MRSGQTDFERKVGELVARVARSPGRWPLRKARRYFEQQYVLYVVEKIGTQRKAAEVLGISFSGLKEKIRKDYLRG